MMKEIKKAYIIPESKAIVMKTRWHLLTVSQTHDDDDIDNPNDIL